MSASRRLAEYYASVSERCDERPRNLPKNDLVIFYVVSVRLEMDMSGFDSVFEQLLTEDELKFLIEALRELGASRLADLFRQAHVRLQDAGFFDEEGAMVADFEQDDAGLLEDIEDEIRAEDSLWPTDEQLAALIYRT